MQIIELKKLVVYIILVFVSQYSFAQSVKEVKANKIKTATVMVTEQVNGKIVTYKDSYEMWDKSGHTLLKAEYHSDGTVKRKETARYDAVGNKIEETLYDQKDKKNYRRVFKYNSNNNRTEEIEYDGISGDVLKKTVMVYDAAGNKTGESIYEGNGNMIKKLVFSYNKKKLKESRQSFSSSGILESMRKYLYEYY